MKNKRIVIDLPKDYNHHSLEVIVLPQESTIPESNVESRSPKKEAQLKDLRSIGTWNEEDLKPIVETKELTNKWKIEKF